MAGRKTYNIAIIGGGAKAAAIAAKAQAMRQAKKKDLHITIFEQESIGANWSGKHGYTDGKQRLCTPAMRDVGFPYTDMSGAAVKQLMQEQFSWQKFLLRKPKAEFAEWVDHGAKPPSHAEFTEYLKWVVKRSKAAIETARVTSIVPAGKQWLVRGTNASGLLEHATAFDGVVVTSPGPARELDGAGDRSRIFDGVDFWQRRKEFTRLVKKAKKSSQIVVIGGGGTAAASISWLVRNGYADHNIVVVAKQGALFTRGNSVFENRLFSDDNAWEQMTTGTREAFFKRLNRSVVWESVMHDIEAATNVSFEDGEAHGYQVDEGGEFTVKVKRDGGDGPVLQPVAVINAAGFDDWWFLSLVDGLDPAKAAEKAFRDGLRVSMAPDLTFTAPLWELPRLHVPAHSSMHGPGLGSLMTLGSMSDRVLGAYRG